MADEGWSQESKSLSVSSLKQAIPFTKEKNFLVSCNCIDYLLIVYDSRLSRTHVDTASFIFQ